MNTLLSTSLDKNGGSTAEMADTQGPNGWGATLPSNVTRTVRLQPAAGETQVDSFTASRMLSATNAATLRQSSSGRLRETGAATAMFRDSDAFGQRRNFPLDNKGMDGMEGTNAITRGFGAIRKEALTAKPGNMEVSYRASTKPEVTIGRGNKILDMGHFAKPEDMHVPQKVRRGARSGAKGSGAIDIFSSTNTVLLPSPTAHPATERKAA